MRVCILTHTFPRFPKDTAAPFMDGVASAIASAGNDVWVLTPYSPRYPNNIKGKTYKIVTYKYAPINSWHKLGYSETLTNDMSLKYFVFLLAPLMFISSILSLYKLVKKEKIEIINAHWILPNGFLAAVVSIVTGVPVVSTLPGSDVYMVGKNSIFSLVGRFTANISAWITSNSGQLLEDLHKFTKVSKNKFSVIIYGVDPAKFKPTKKMVSEIKKSLEISSKDVVVVSVGRLVAKKGFVYLIKAAPKILSRNKNVKFVIIGEGDQRAELEQLASKLKVSKHFRFPGWVDYKNLVHYYNLADVFILPSIRDEKGNLDDQSVSVVEAMACGCPIVTTDFPGYKVVVSDSQNGFLVPEKNSSEIASALGRLIKSKILRIKMGRESRSAVLKKFSWDAIGEQYTDLFNQVINNTSYSEALPSIKDIGQRRRKAKQIVGVLENHLGDLSKLKCLDVGCSSGVISEYLARYFKEVIAVDVDDKAILIANKNNKKRNLKFLNMPGEKMNFKNNNFDVVVANQIYEFVDSPEKTFGEIYRVLKKGGICFLGARNKFAIIEAQYNFPFLSFLPKGMADLIVKLTGKGNKFIGKYKTLTQLTKLVSKFELHDYTIKIIKNPQKYSFGGLEEISLVAKFIPLKYFKYFLPNYIWILEKK